VGEKYVQDEFLGEESLGEKYMGEKYVGEKYVGEKSVGEKYMGDFFFWRWDAGFRSPLLRYTDIHRNLGAYSHVGMDQYLLIPFLVG